MSLVGRRLALMDRSQPKFCARLARRVDLSTERVAPLDKLGGGGMPLGLRAQSMAR
jgi:hypothetical protein